MKRSQHSIYALLGALACVLAGCSSANDTPIDEVTDDPTGSGAGGSTETGGSGGTPTTSGGAGTVSTTSGTGGGGSGSTGAGGSMGGAAGMGGAGGNVVAPPTLWTNVTNNLITGAAGGGD